MKKLTINHLAVWVCIVLAHILGFLWYGVLFQEQWMELAGLTMEEIEANPAGASHWISNFIATVAPIYLLAWLYSKLEVRSGIKGAVIALLITFTFAHLTMMTTGLFEGEPYGLAWINGGQSMLAMAVSGFILGAWKKYVS